MKKTSYRDRDYTFGQALQKLRSTIGITQAELAQYLGISRRALVDWEVGNRYPKPQHLKQFITLAIRYEAFEAGSELTQIQSLWRAAHQKEWLDEEWLASLLLTSQKDKATTRIRSASSSGVLEGLRVDWGEAPAVSNFYGRQEELYELERWIIEERCRVVGLLGLGGIGKSALAVNFMHGIADHFEVIIWRSLKDAPNCEVLLKGCLQVLEPEALSKVSPALEPNLSLLLEHLRNRRVLLVLDNLETVLEEGQPTGYFRNGFENYRNLLRRVAETEHQSCLLFTSREKLADLVSLEGKHSSVRILRLSSLNIAACEQLLKEKNITGSSLEWEQLIEAYGGNPLALKIVGQTIVDLFGGVLASFLNQGQLVFGGVRTLLGEQFNRLSQLEQTVLLWLSILREPATLDELMAVLLAPLPRLRLLEAIESLHRRSLIERAQKPGSFTVQSVVLEYVTNRLVNEAGQEIEQSGLARLVEHGLVLAKAREYVRQTQLRLLVAPILEYLTAAFPEQIALEEHLLDLLKQLKLDPKYVRSYAPANLLSLIYLVRGGLHSLDLSGLLLRGAYLQGVRMEDTSLIGATVQDSVFTETFSAITTVAISSSGEYWAAGTLHGEIRIWLDQGLSLQHSWLAHADLVWPLVFSPDQSILVSAGWDDMLKLWEVSSGNLLWSDKYPNHINSLTFAPDGGKLAISSGQETILWDIKQRTSVQALEHSAVVIAEAWSPDGQFIATGDIEGNIRLWEVNEAGIAHFRRKLVGHAVQVSMLVFSPDSSLLASASWDGPVRLWNVVNGELRQVLNMLSNQVHRVAWSADGQTLAGGSRSNTLWLWNMEQNRYQAMLYGHTAGVTSLAFTPDSRNLLSGSEDGTLRIWDGESGQLIRVIEGSSFALFNLDWSPDSTHLVSGGSDGLVTIFDVTGTVPPKILTGHRGVIFGVGWRPDGRTLASSEWDNSIRLWDYISGECVEILENPAGNGNFFYEVAWSPDGQWLASGTNKLGIQVFDLSEEGQGWAGQDFQTWVRHISWSPDGRKLAGGGDDGSVYIWNAADGTLLHRLPTHYTKITNIAWHPDGTRLASCGNSSEGGGLLVWDVQRWEPVVSLSGRSEMVSALTWSSNGDVLISGDSAGALRWWKVPEGELLTVREAHQGMIQALRVSPNKTMLASCGDDGAIMLWDLSSGQYLKTLRRDRPYERLNITGVRGLTEAQKATLRALGAIEE